MDKKALISPAFEKGHSGGLVGEAKYLRQSSIYKQILPRPIRRSFSEGGTPTRLKIPVISLAKNLFNQRNPQLINDLRLRKITYEKINLFLQNEPNFKKVKLSVTIEMKKDYEQMDTWSIRKNEPKTNPIQNQYKPNSKPIQTQTNPISPRFGLQGHLKGGQ